MLKRRLQSASSGSALAYIYCIMTATVIRNLTTWINGETFWGERVRRSRTSGLRIPGIDWVTATLRCNVVVLVNWDYKSCVSWAFCSFLLTEESRRARGNSHGNAVCSPPCNSGIVSTNEGWDTSPSKILAGELQDSHVLWETYNTSTKRLASIFSVIFLPCQALQSSVFFLLF